MVSQTRLSLFCTKSLLRMEVKNLEKKGVIREELVYQVKRE